MLTLILNSMEGPMQMILAKPDHIGQNTLSMLDTLCWESEGQGAETLIPNLSALLKKNKLTPTSIKRIACVRGPGSFTGIRLALTTALGLSRSIPGTPDLAGLDYLLLVAVTVANKKNITARASIWVLTHARRGQVHIQGFATGEATGKPIPLVEAAGCIIENAIALIIEKSQSDAPIYLVGTGLARNKEQFTAGIPEAISIDNINYPSPEVLTEAASSAKYSNKPIAPLYLRASDAEENLPYVAAGLGLDPHQAMLDLLKLTGRNT